MKTKTCYERSNANQSTDTIVMI